MRKRVALICGLAGLPMVAGAQNVIVFADALGPGFQNWSWATVNLSTASPVHGGLLSISFEPDNFEGLYFASPGIVRSFTDFDGIILQDSSGGNQPAVYVDDVILEQAGPPPGPVTVSIDLGGPRRTIDPLIYGVNFGSDAQHADLRYPTRRWGGNSTSRYNWQFDVHNTANDYFFQNIADGDGVNLPDHSSANQFVIATKAQGGEALLTVPTLGWVPKDSRNKLWGFSQQLYGAQTSDECRYYGPNPPFWCSADAGNGLCTTGGFCQGGKIVGNNPLDTSKPAPVSYAGDWVTHLRARHSTAAQGGVKFFALDNEAMLWDSTHRDVHPQPATYDEVWTRGRDRALAIKAIEPDALIFGPVTWGWCDFWTSAADAALGNCFDGPDRLAHGGMPFIEWYLQQVCADTGPGGVRAVDYLDLHYYPQGAGIDGLDNDAIAGEQPDVQARRMRSLRELYDGSYASESWIGQTAYPIPNLLPRARAAIDMHCPGTRLALTEYKWGPDNGISGAVAQAELLAIFGREGVDYATRWVAPEDGTLAEQAFRLYLNYDGSHTRVSGDSVPASSSAPDSMGAYAIERADGALQLLLFNRGVTARDVTVDLAGAGAQSYSGWRLSSAGFAAFASNQSLSAASLSLAGLPPLSASLLLIQRQVLDGLIFADGFE